MSLLLYQYYDTIYMKIEGDYLKKIPLYQSWHEYELIQ